MTELYEDFKEMKIIETDLCPACSVRLSGGRGGKTSSCLIPDKAALGEKIKLFIAGHFRPVYSMYT